MSFTRLVRFVPASDSSAVLIGEPLDANQDVGFATRKGEEVRVKVFSGKSALSPGELTDKVEKVGRLLSPLAREEVGTIRCIGLNVGRPPSTTLSINNPATHKAENAKQKRRKEKESENRTRGY